MRAPLAVAFLALALALAACGDERKEVGEVTIDLTGNEVKVEALRDPKVAGVTCHITHFDRGFLDRVFKGNWFEDPSNSSIACRQTAPIRIGDIALSKGGEEVFSQRQSLVFKSLAVRRIYDAENDTLVYVTHGRQVVEGSAKMAISSVALYNADVSWLGGRPAASD
jgi:CreA protein